MVKYGYMHTKGIRKNVSDTSGNDARASQSRGSVNKSECTTPVGNVAASVNQEMKDAYELVSGTSHQESYGLIAGAFLASEHAQRILAAAQTWTIGARARWRNLESTVFC